MHWLRAVAVVVVAAEADARQITIVRAPADRVCAEARLEAVPVCEGAICPPRVAAGVDAATLELADDVPWAITARAPGCWSETISIAAGSTRSDSATIRLWKSARVRGRLLVPRGEARPKSLALRFESVPAATSPIAPTEAECTTAGDEWECEVPAVPLDLRLRAADFVPHYFWGVAAGAGDAKLGDVELVRGGSVVGRVTFGEGEAPPVETVSVEVVPEAAGEIDAAEAKRLARRGSVVKPNRRGFFQVTGLGRGSYRVVAKAAGRPAVRRTSVVIDDTGETSLGVLQIDPPAAIDVFVDPPRDPAGRKWIVQVRSLDPVARTSVVVSKQTADDAGRSRHADLEPGVYGVQVHSQDGVRFGAQTVEVGRHTPPVSVRVTAVEVRGIVTVHEERAANVELVFQNSNLGSPVSARTNAYGVYKTMLPAEGSWSVQVRRQDSGVVVREGVAVKKGDELAYARVDIALAGGRARGKVVDEAGRPAAAVLRLIRRQRVDGTYAVREDGKFELVGLEPGEVLLIAEDQAGRRGSTAYEIKAEDSPDATVTLARAPRIQGRVVDAAGRPIAGAVVEYLVPWSYREETTGPDGTFELLLYRPDVPVDVRVIAPSYPIKLVTLAARTEPVTLVLGASPAGVIEVLMSRVPPHVRMFAHGSSTPFHVPLIRPYQTSRPHARTPDHAGPLLELEPGLYSFCPAMTMDERCVTERLLPGGRVQVDARAWFE